MSERCDDCGTELIDKCAVCGAPICCPLCCARSEITRLCAEVERLTKELIVARGAVAMLDQMDDEGQAELAKMRDERDAIRMQNGQLADAVDRLQEDVANALRALKEHKE